MTKPPHRTEPMTDTQRSALPADDDDYDPEQPSFGSLAVMQLATAHAQRARVVHEPEHHQWIECSVRVPGTTGDIEVQSLAKVRCDDVIDALDLPRWAAFAFQHLWRSANRASQRELGLALWYLKRATSGHHADARCIASLLRRLLELSEQNATPLHELLQRFAQAAADGESAALELIHEAATKEP